MASTINTNINSLNAQRNLAMTQSSLATSMQRLSSGLRINSAKDDAAGLSISERFTTQIRGLTQAARNANDGISLAQTAEGALGEITSNLQRIRELAVQSANATNSTSDRAALNQEVQQRLAEIDRVSAQTSFNGQKVLDGSFGNAVFQVGADVGQTINVSLETSTRQNAIGKIASAASVDLSTVISAGSPAATEVLAVGTTSTIGSVNYGSTVTAPATSGALGTFTAGGAETGTSAAYTYTLSLDDGINAATTITDTVASSGTGTDVTFAAALTSAGFTADGSSVGGFTVNYGAADIGTALSTGTLSFSRADGTNFTVTEAFGGTGTPTSTVGFNDTGVLGAGGTTTTTDGAIDTSANKTLTVADSGGTPVSFELTTNITDAAGLLAVIQADSDYSAASFTAALNGTSDKIVFTQKAGTTGDLVVGGTSAITGTATTTGVTAASLVADNSVSVTAGSFTIAVGTGAAVDVAAKTYTTSQSLVDAVNGALGSNGYASLDATTGKMNISSGEAITIGGTTGTTTLGFSATNAAGGDLTKVNVSSVADSNDAIQRVDSALNSVSTLRSTFGAIQNRFDSVIASLSITSENLSASRSRVQDADFAQETANLSRAQILQQAGTAMVAQANQLPQGVLALLR